MGTNTMNAKLVLLAIALCASGSYALTCGVLGANCGATNCLVTEITPSGGTASTVATCGSVGSGNCASSTTSGGDVRVLCKASDTASSYTIPSGTSCPTLTSSVGRTATVSFAGLFLALIAFYLN